MEFEKSFTWLAKIAFWVTAALLAIGVYMTRSPWWLVGFGLLLFVSFRVITLCRMPLSSVLPLFLCDIYFVVAFGKIISDKNASAWWLIVALVLEAMIVGNAQNQVDEDEKKSKIARETEKGFAEEEKNAVQPANSDEAEEDECKTVKSKNIEKRKREASETTKVKTSKKDIDDDFGKLKAGKIKNNIARTKTVNETIKTISEAFDQLTNQQLCCIVRNSGSSVDDITIAKDLLIKRNALGLLSKINNQ